MSWFNSGLNTFKEQLTTLAQEVLAEKSEEVNFSEGLECEKQNAELILQCSAKDAEIASLRKQIAILEKNGSLEGSWVCEPENLPTDQNSGKNDNERNSESSNGGEMITIPLENAIPGESGSWEKIVHHKTIEESDHKLKKVLEENLNLKKKIVQLNTDNQELTENLETLDSQHNIAIQELLEIKNELQSKFSNLNVKYNTLKTQYENSVTDAQKDLENLKVKLEDRYEKEVETLHETVEKLEQQIVNLKKTCEVKDRKIEELLEKNNAYEDQLKINNSSSDKQTSKLQEEIGKLREQLEKYEEDKIQDGKIIDLSGSISKQGSEDGFIVLQNESGSQTPENWEKKYKDSEEEKLFLESKISDLDNKLMKTQLEKSDLEKTIDVRFKSKDANIFDLEKEIKENYELIRKLENEIKILNESRKMKQELECSTQEVDKNIVAQNSFIDVEVQMNQIKEINEDLKREIRKKDSTISELTEKLTKCEANASDVESRLMMENVDLQKRIIDMESLQNEKHKETISLRNTSSNHEHIQRLLSAYLQIDLNIDDATSMESALKLIREKFSQLEVLEKNIKQMAEEISRLKSEKSAVEHEKKTLQADIVHYEEECEELMKNNEVLLNELENLKRNKLETISENGEESIIILEKQLEEYNNLNKTLEEQYKDLLLRVEELESEKKEYSSKLKKLQDVNDNLDKSLKTFKHKHSVLEEENCRLIFEINEMKTDDKKSAMESEILEYKTRQQTLEKQLERLGKDHADLVSAMQSQQSAFVQYKKESETAVGISERQLKEQQVLYIAKENECHKLEEKIESLQLKLSETIAQMENMQKQVIELEKEKLDMENKNDSFQEEKQRRLQEKLIQTTSNNNESQTIDFSKDLEEISKLRQNIEILKNENNNLIQAVTLKHNENVQYYSELQRLNQLLKLENEKSEIAKSNCENCVKMQEEKSEIESSHLDELGKLKDQINFLKEKSDILTTNLLTEQTNQKLLQQEKMEFAEQNNNLTKDLERLRQHLVELEETHTQETIEMQNVIKETKTKMAELQKEVANSSNAYTSASIRANQHAETLQAQYVLVLQQRDELATKLSKAEDRESKNQAALVNLQCALEQFQKEKESDVLLATNRIQKELRKEQEKQNQLKTEISSLNQQLAKANQGLLAATRLSNQLETSQMTISTLKEQISKLENVNRSLEEKLVNNEASQEDKIEKSLVKSLIIGYIVSSNENDKTQILKMITSVLNFDQNEVNKIGLNRQGQSGWFSGFLHGSSQETSTSSSDGLVKAFVAFLEKESQPRNNPGLLPNLLNIVSSNNLSSADPTISSTSTERKISVDQLSTSSTSHKQSQSILDNESVLEQFAPTRNSTSILKDILSDK